MQTPPKPGPTKSISLRVRVRWCSTRSNSRCAPGLARSLARSSAMPSCCCESRVKSKPAPPEIRVHGIGEVELGLRAELCPHTVFTMAGPQHERIAQLVDPALEARLRNADVIRDGCDVHRCAQAGGKPAQEIRRLRARPVRALERIAVDDIQQTRAQGRSIFPRRRVARHRARKSTDPEIDLPTPNHRVQPRRQSMPGVRKPGRRQLIDAESFSVARRRRFRGQEQE